MHRIAAPLRAWTWLRAASRWAVVLAAAWLTFGWPIPARALDPDKPFHQYVSDHWSIEEGLPQISVFAIAQDSDGYIWLGTQLGIARFDGIRFMNLSPRNDPELPGELTNALAAGEDGSLWIGTYKGLAVRRDGRIRRIEPLSGGEVEVTDVRIAPDHSVLVATRQGLMVVHGEGLDRYAGIEAPTFALAFDAGGGQWAGGRGGVYRLGAGNAPPVFERLPVANASEVQVTRLEFDDGRLWAATNIGLFVRSEGAWRAAELPAAMRGDPVSMLYRDSDGNLWVGALSGLLRLRAGGVTEFVPRGSAGTFPDYRVGFEDREGNLWLGSRADGVSRVYNGWTRRYSRPEGIAEPLVWSLEPDPDGSIWVGTDSGVERYHHGRFEKIIDADRLPHPNAYTLFRDGAQLWIGTRRGLALWREGQGLQTLPARLQPLVGPQINGILRDRHDRLWFATTEGIYGERPGGVLEHAPLDGASARFLFESGDGTLWVGTTRGLWRRDGLQFAPVAASEAGLPANADILSIHERANGDIIASTLSGQLLLRRGRAWSLIDSSVGLPENPAFFLAEDARGWLWWGGLNGISRARIGDIYGVVEGRQVQIEGEFLLNERGSAAGGQKGYCCNGAGNAKGFLRDGGLWLPSRDGIVEMDLDGIVKNAVPPSIVVERYRYGDEWLRAPHDGGEVTLPRGQRDLSIEFTALSFQDPHAVRMRTRLDGYDRDWNALEETSRRWVRYTNLPPGEYRFEVQAANNAGVWNPELRQFVFSVPAYFHETLWFRSLLLLVVAGGLAVLWNWRARSDQRMRERLEGLVDQRTEALAELNRQLRHASATDPLTGLFNRRSMQETIERELTQPGQRNGAPRSGQTVMLLVLLDIDHFKQINDRHGHAAGDAVLVEFARLISTHQPIADDVAPPTHAARWGGEEFLIVYHPMERAQVITLVESLCRMIASHSFALPNGDQLSLTTSIGFAEIPLRSNDSTPIRWEHWLELADHALYDAKDSGRARWAGFRLSRETQVARVQLGSRPGVARLVAEGQLMFVRA